MAEKRTIELEVTTNEKSLKAQLREAQAEVQKLAEKFGATSNEAVRAAKKAAELKDAIEDAKALTDAYNPDAKFNALSSSIGGVLNGFQAFEGALGLVGVESENVQKALLRVQSAMALTQGINGVLEAKEGFKNLGKQVSSLATSAVSSFKNMTTAGKAFAITGIGLLITAVALLIANFDKLKDAFSTGLSKAKAFEQGVTEQAAAARDAINNFGEYERTLRRLGNTEDDIQEKRRKRFDEAIKQTQREIEASKKTYKEQLKNLETVKEFDAWGMNATGRLLYGDEEDAKEQRKKIKETKDQLEKLKNDKFEFEQKIKDDAKKKREEDLQDYKDKIKAKQDLINEDLAKIRENNKAALEENQARLRTEQEQEEFLVNEKFNEQIKLAKKYRKDTSQLETAQANEINDIRLKYQELDYKQKEEARQKELDAIKQANDLKKQAEEEFQAQIEEIDEANFQAGLQKTMSEDEYALELVRQKYFALEEAAKGNAEQLAIIETAKALEIEAINAKAEEVEAARKKRNRDFAVEMAISGFNTIASLTELFGKKSEKAARNAFRINKGAQIASATMSTYQSAQQAYASQFLPIPDPSSPIRGAVAAGAAVFAGLANVAKIASQKFEGGGSSGGGGGVSAASAAAGGGAQMAAPQFNTIGSSGINQLAQLQQQPTQAYVVSGHVTSAQALDRNRVQNATL
jgi:hypothetical protein